MKTRGFDEEGFAVTVHASLAQKHAAMTRIAAIAGAIVLSVLGMYCWVSFGVYSDRMSGGLHVFSKHRMSFRFYFHAPISESDTPYSSLSSRAQRAEMDYAEFVERHSGRARKFTIFK